MLNINFKINNFTDDNEINKNSNDKVPIKLPNNSLFNEVVFLRTFEVPNRRRKSKKKLIIKTKSKYIFMISPLLLYKEKNDLYVVSLY